MNASNDDNANATTNDTTNNNNNNNNNDNNNNNNSNNDNKALASHTAACQIMLVVFMCPVDRRDTFNYLKTSLNTVAWT